MKITPTFYAQAYVSAVTGVAPVELKKIAHRFWQTVWRHKRFTWRKEILRQVQRLEREQAGVIDLQLASARELTSEALQDLTKKFEKVLGARVYLDVVVKPHLLSGFVITLNDIRYDVSLKGRLDALERALAGTM